MCTFFKGVQRTQIVEGWTLPHIYPMSDGTVVLCSVTLWKMSGLLTNITERMSETEQQFKLDPPVSKVKSSSLTLQLQNSDFSGSLLGGRREGGKERELKSDPPHFSILISNQKSPGIQEKAAMWETSKVLILHIRWGQKQGNKIKVTPNGSWINYFSPLRWKLWFICWQRVKTLSDLINWVQFLWLM